MKKPFSRPGKNVILAAAALLAALLLFSLVSCRSGTGDDGAKAGTENESAEIPVTEKEGVTVFENGAYTAGLFRTEQTTDMLNRYCATLRTALAEITGVTPELEEDFLRPDETVPAEQREILIGLTAHFDVEEASDRLGYTDFAVRVEENKVLLYGRTIAADCAAVQYLIDFLKENYPVGSQKIVIPAEISTVAPIPESVREYRGSTEGFQITYFWGPTAYKLDEEGVKAIADAGITVMPIRVGADEQSDRIIRLIGKYGMKVSVIDNRTDFDASPDYTDDGIAQVLADYADYDNIYEWWFRDEPQPDELLSLKNAVDGYKKLDPEAATRGCYINLFPDRKATKGYYYENALHLLGVHYISFDRYTFFSGEESGDAVPRNFHGDTEYFRNMGDVILVAEANGTEAAMIVQLDRCYSPCDLSKEEIRWEFNTALAYGFKTVSYFTWYRSWKNGDGTLSDTYYKASAVNAECRPIGDELYSKHPTGAYFIDSEHYNKDVRDYTPECSALGQVDGDKLLIGLFDDGSAYLVDLYYNTADGETHTRTVSGVKEGLEYFDGAAGEWKDASECEAITLTEDGYSITFEPSEGFLLRVSDQ